MGVTSNAPHLKIDTTKLPKEVQDAIATKDQLKATEAYIKYCDSLFHKSKTAGETVQESVINVFGKETFTRIKKNACKFISTVRADKLVKKINDNGNFYASVVRIY